MWLKFVFRLGWLSGGLATAAIAAAVLLGSVQSRRQIMFVSNIAGNSDIYTVDLNTQLQRNLTDHRAYDDYAAWSPDGERIVFISDRDGAREVFVMNADGGDVRQLTRAGSDSDLPAWSPDGRAIAYQVAMPFQGQRTDIWVLDLESGAARSITNHPANDRYPAWSPDGTRVAFLSDRTSEDEFSQINELYLVDADGGHLRQLTRLNAWISSPTWSPDGRDIFFTLVHDGTVGIYAVNVTRRTLRPVLSSAASDPIWSPDGRYLAFFSAFNGLTQQIHTLEIDSGAVRELTNDPLSARMPRWSPDGSQLAYVAPVEYWLSSPRGGAALAAMPQIFIINVDGGSGHSVTHNQGGAISPTWRPG